MSFKCKIGIHSWDGCKCSNCGKNRDIQHSWDGCKCSKCRQSRDEPHKWDGCKCLICNKTRNEQHNMVDNKCVRCGVEQGFFIDTRDGHEYKWIKICEQIWMAENLAYKTDCGCWAYDDDESNVDKYGYLYNWETAKKVCPSGWHLPTTAEWMILTIYLGGESIAGGKLKEVGTVHWLSPNAGADNISGFTALPGGCCIDGIPDQSIESNGGSHGSWWTVTEIDAKEACFRYLRNDNAFIGHGSVVKDFGYSVRCLKD